MGKLQPRSNSTILWDRITSRHFNPSGPFLHRIQEDFNFRVAVVVLRRYQMREYVDKRI